MVGLDTKAKVAERLKSLEWRAKHLRGQFKAAVSVFERSESSEDRRRLLLPYDQLTEVINNLARLGEYVDRYELLPPITRLADPVPPPYFKVSEADRTPDREDGLPFDPDPE